MADETRDRDVEKLAELGYKQELNRGWSQFANFAISFSIISVLAGCFTIYGQAWNFGGPIAISIGWPVIALIILTVAFSMSELTSAFPTAGGPYWWAHRLGGTGWSWFTGWFNVIGLFAIVASVDYFCAFFATSLFGLWGWDLGFVNFADSQHVLAEIFWVYTLILILHALINIYSHHLVALFSSISVFWHVIGTAIIIGILIIVPDRHQSVDFVFTERINNSGFGMGMYWWFILPAGFLLTMYTITGYDASAHVSEETYEAEQAAAKGVWQSVASSALIGWFVLLAITFAATDVNAVNDAFGTSISVFTSADMSRDWAEAIILIAVIGQLFCGMACVTSCSRDLLRVLARPSRTGLEGVEQGGLQGSADQRRARQLRGSVHPGPARAAGQGRHRAAGGADRGHLDRHDRPLHRLRRPGVPALARRRVVPAGLVEPG